MIETGDVGHNSLLIRPQSAHDIYSKASGKRERERDSSEAKQPKACVSPPREEGMVMHFMGSPFKRKWGLESSVITLATRKVRERANLLLRKES